MFDLPHVPKKRRKGRLSKYGTNRLSLAKRGGHRRGWTSEVMTLYGQEQTVTYKTFLATHRPARGMIRVVIVKRSPELFIDTQTKWIAFFCVEPAGELPETDIDVPVRTILECVADRSAIEQNFHDVKEVHGAGQQQVRNVWSRSPANGSTWCNVACWHLCLWLHTLVELWSWRRSGTTLKQRDDRPWEVTEAADRSVRKKAEGGRFNRRPSHADRIKTLKKQVLSETFSRPPRPQRSNEKFKPSSKP